MDAWEFWVWRINVDNIMNQTVLHYGSNWINFILQDGWCWTSQCSDGYICTDYIHMEQLGVAIEDHACSLVKTKLRLPSVFRDLSMMPSSKLAAMRMTMILCMPFHQQWLPLHSIANYCVWSLTRFSVLWIIFSYGPRCFNWEVLNISSIDLSPALLMAKNLNANSRSWIGMS